MVVERTSDELIIHLSASMDANRLQNLLDYFRYLEITSKFNVSQKSVDEMVEGIKKSRRKKTKSLKRKWK